MNRITITNKCVKKKKKLINVTYDFEYNRSWCINWLKYAWNQVNGELI